MKLNRLFEIVYILINKQQVTAKELAERFEVSQRTIYRDIDTLSQSGIPVYASKGKGGGISLIDGYKIDRAMLTKDEQNEIISALQSLKAVNAEAEHNALSKLSSFFDAGNSDWIEIDFSSFSANVNWKNNFENIKQSIFRKQVMKIEYANLKGEIATRNIEPVKLIFKGISWYLYAYCQSKNGYRMFKLNRIISLEMSDEYFEPHKNLPKSTQANIAPSSDGDMVFKVDKSLAYRVFDDFKRQDITRDTDGNYIVKTNVFEREWAISYILSLGDKAQCIEPKSLREEIENILANSIENYKSDI